MRVGLETRLGQVERRIAAMIRAIEDGLHQPAMKEQMIALETEKAQITAEVATKPSVRPVVLHPNLPAIYRRKVEELEAVLVTCSPGRPRSWRESTTVIAHWRRRGERAGGSC